MCGKSVCRCRLPGDWLYRLAVDWHHRLAANWLGSQVWIGSVERSWIEQGNIVKTWYLMVDYQKKRWWFADPALTWSSRSLCCWLKLGNSHNAATVSRNDEVQKLWRYIVSCEKKLHDRLWHLFRSWIEFIKPIKIFSVEWFIQF